MVVPLPGFELAAALAQLSLSEPEIRLVRLALDLGAQESGGPLSEEERRLARLAREAPPAATAERRQAAEAIRAGEDPLGAQLCRIRPAVARRANGAFLTPPSLVEPMLDWVLARQPERFVDPGCGSGRFAAGVVRRRPDVDVVAVDVDPVATLLTRAALTVLGARSATVRLADYTAFDLPPVTGRTAFVGNPPYVRHHDLPTEMKARAAALGKMLGYRVSGLAGLHAYFFLATAL
jgi:SAM-dependent methyltransferase